ncbi:MULTISPECIES: phospholipase D family protein [unclassified Xanthobacter]|uniref:phospholipase D family protein n=1 Tax=unclassified Xanthobacter TaxID=2623496 RepID=UPI001EE0E471|nr:MULTISPECIES: phospholipase D family protein [unclassified Xanthobacter]
MTDTSAMRFLDEKAVLKEIKSMLAAAREAKIAVAFWGQGALEQLDIGRTNLDVKLICNLDSGGCNPAALKSIMSTLPPARVHSHPRLHAKVYWTPDRAIVGSSNASANGLAVEGNVARSWAEANILISDRRLLQEIEDWFNRRLDEARIITDHDLSLAQSLWDYRSRAAAPGVALCGDLLQAYAQAPDHPSWRRVRVALWSAGISKEGKKEATALINENSTLSQFAQYEGWTKEFYPDDYILDFYVKNGKSKFSGIYIIEYHRGKTINFATERNTISLPSFPELKLSDNDISKIKIIAQKLLNKYSEDGSSVSLMLSDIANELNK